VRETPYCAPACAAGPAATPSASCGRGGLSRAGSAAHRHAAARVLRTPGTSCPGTRHRPGHTSRGRDRGLDTLQGDATGACTDLEGRDGGEELPLRLPQDRHALRHPPPLLKRRGCRAHHGSAPSRSAAAQCSRCRDRRENARHAGVQDRAKRILADGEGGTLKFELPDLVGEQRDLPAQLLLRGGGFSLS